MELISKYFKNTNSKEPYADLHCIVKPFQYMTEVRRPMHRLGHSLSQHIWNSVCNYSVIRATIWTIYTVVSRWHYTTHLPVLTSAANERRWRQKLVCLHSPTTGSTVTRRQRVTDSHFRLSAAVCRTSLLPVSWRPHARRRSVRCSVANVPMKRWSECPVTSFRLKASCQ